MEDDEPGENIYRIYTANEIVTGCLFACAIRVSISVIAAASSAAAGSNYASRGGARPYAYIYIIIRAIVIRLSPCDDGGGACGREQEDENVNWVMSNSGLT